MTYDQLSPQQQQDHVAKTTRYLQQTLPRIKSQSPSLQGLINFNIGKHLASVLKSAQAFTTQLYTLHTYHSHIPQLEKYLRTITYLPQAAKLTASLTPAELSPTTQPISAPPTVNGSASAIPPTAVFSSTHPQSTAEFGSTQSTPHPSHIRDYPPSSLPEHVRSFGLNHYQRLRSEFTIAHDTLRTLTSRSLSATERVGDMPSPQLLQQAADHVCLKEQRLRNFHALLDAHWQNYLGHALPEGHLDTLQAEFASLSKQDTDTLAPAVQPLSAQRLSPKLTLSELQSLPDSDRKTAAIQARIERNKKYLRRTDRQPSEETKANIALAVQELHSLSILITDKQAEVASHYGYQVPLEWQEPSLAERKAAQAKAKSDKAKAQRAQARQAKLQAKAEELANNPYL